MQHEQKMEELIIKSFSEEITSGEKAVLNKWIKDNAENEAYFAQLKNIWQVSHPAFAIAEIDTEKAEENINRQLNRQHYRRSQNSLFVWWQRVAAVIVLPFMLLAGYLLLRDASPVITETVYQEVVAPHGVHSRINLPDGSIAWLNSGSKLQYPVVPQKGKRDVFLSGEAYFEVQSDKNNPFLVTTENVTIKATGTAFNVEAYSSDTIVAVTLIEGKISVNINGKDGIEMMPNQRITYNNTYDKHQLEEVSPYKWYAWKDGVLMFRNDRLDYVFKRIGLIYNVDIAVKDSEIASQLYRATFEGESLDEILRLMKMTAPIEYKKRGRVMSADGLYNKEKIEVYKKAP